MTNTNLDSEHLLRVKSKVNEYRRALVAHQKFDNILSEATSFLLTSSEPRIVLIYGATGCGKSALLRTLQKEVSRKLQNISESSADIRTVTAMSRVPTKQPGPFRWAPIYLTGLSALDEPLIQYKTKRRRLVRDKEGRLLLDEIPGDVLQDAFIQCLTHRRVATYFWDEAQHFTMVGKGEQLQDQMENIKYIVDESTTNFVLAGTYPLKDLYEINGQLGRRCKVFPFERYTINGSPKDRAEFASIVDKFQRLLPIPINTELKGDLDFIYERSLGCIGLAKDLLSDALDYALSHMKKAITLDMIDNLVNWHLLVRIKDEIEQGEVDLRPSEIAKAKNVVKQFLSTTPQQEPVREAPLPIGPTRRNNRRPGQRNPSRDPAGPGEEMP